MALRQSLIDGEGFDRELDAPDQFEAQARRLLTDPKTATPSTSARKTRDRDRYGRNRWGQQLLLARRLVEAGAEIATSSLSGAMRPGGKLPPRGEPSRLRRPAVPLRGLRPGGHGPDRDIYARAWIAACWWSSPANSAARPDERDRSTGAGDASRGGHGAARPRPLAARLLQPLGRRRNPYRPCHDTAAFADVTERVCARATSGPLYRHLGIDGSKVLINDFNGRPTPRPRQADR
ncbi:MAG: hypothetical protein WKF75_03380 [Singulisphaera sp.]